MPFLGQRDPPGSGGPGPGFPAPRAGRGCGSLGRARLASPGQEPAVAPAGPQDLLSIPALPGLWTAPWDRNCRVCVCLRGQPGSVGGPGSAGSTDLSCLAGPAVGAGTVRGWCPCRGAAAAVVLRRPRPPSLAGGSELPVTVSGQNRARRGTAQSCCVGIDPGGAGGLMNSEVWDTESPGSQCHWF